MMSRQSTAGQPEPEKTDAELVQQLEQLFGKPRPPAPPDVKFTVPPPQVHISIDAPPADASSSTAAAAPVASEADPKSTG